MRTITVRRIIPAPNNYRSILGVFHVAVHPAEGAEPNGVGAIRKFTSAALKVTEDCPSTLASPSSSDVF